jgi:thiol-disulfide isomerase/thioredoxin
MRSTIAALIVSAVAIGIAACGSPDEPTSAASGARPAGKAPSAPALRKLERQANRLLDGGPDAFKRRLAELEGHPVVVNQWASWCPPCRFEFPFFQRLARKYRGRVAFLGVDSQDNRDDARKFLEEFPTPYPHYFDPEAEIARVFRGGVSWPTTAYFNAGGELTRTHHGAFATQAKLEEEIRRYGING